MNGYIQDVPRQPETGLGGWHWHAGLARIAILLLVAAGAYLVGNPGRGAAPYLAIFYAFGLASGIFFLLTYHRKRSAPRALIWAQILVDFSTVAATVNFTGGPTSLFTFLFVVAILETAIFLGIPQGFWVATMAAAAMGIEALPFVPESRGMTGLELVYGFIVQSLAFYLAAAVCGFWNLQITRLRQFQREILDNMNSGFLIVDRSGRIVALNKAAARILDIRGEPPVGALVDELLRPDSGAECPVTTALRSERDFTSYEFYCVMPSGSTKLIGLTTSRMRDPKGNLSGVIVSFTDLTDVNEMRKELQRQERMATVGELAAGLAHEIRNPVAAIRGAMDELRSRLPEESTARRLAQIAIRESDQLNGIVAGFLDFARDPKLRRERVDLRALLHEARDFCAPRATCAIRIEDTPGDCAVEGDPSQLRQVFINILHNAMEAMHGKGVIQIHLSRTPGFVETRIEDTGPGIDPDKVDRVFEPFYTTKERGTGMGLAVCHRIVTAHDGTIRATSRAGGGASMVVRLPAGGGEDARR